MSEIDILLDQAMLAANALSNKAKAEGDLPTMRAANRAWFQLFDASKDRIARRTALAGHQ